MPLAAPIPSALHGGKQDHPQGPWLLSQAPEECHHAPCTAPVTGHSAAGTQPRGWNGVVRQLCGRKPREIFLGVSDEKEVNFLY